MDVAREPAGKKLLHFVHPDKLGTFRNGSTRETFVTPTPYAPDEAPSWLQMPAAWVHRTHLLILDPAYIPAIQGPVWVATGRGIQYILSFGFPAAAIIVPGAPSGAWEIEVR